ncbi:serine protease inhibitor ecotin [Sphingomonas naasensis]|uniref:Serine protease inhibitor ecotin n=1 Tax=Sphingomonas naasensis TaxID=1344951 RepID=A0A4S1WGM7_9SPHN|nr:serine protease inhibitor ecotin [Sphingomonas naasensis]
MRRRARALPLGAAVLACLGVGVAPAMAQRTAQQELAAFPQAPAGQVRRVIFVPKEANEDGLRIGLIVGRTMRVDCNRHLFAARIETRTVQGWGYDYFVVTEAGAPASTLMACPPGSERREFVRAAEEPLLRYNSRLPVVVFAPAGVEVRYRIWRAGREAVAR